MLATIPLTAKTTSSTTYAYCQTNSQHWDLTAIEDITYNGDPLDWDHATERHQAKIPNGTSAGDTLKFTVTLQRTNIPVDGPTPSKIPVEAHLIPIPGDPIHIQRDVPWPDTSARTVRLESGQRIEIDLENTTLSATIDEVW